MFNSVEIENVRIFSEKSWKFSLSPLTVFCGTNGSGKSTIIKSLLLLKQSQAQSSLNENLNGKLSFVGKYVDLGNYDSLVSFGNSEGDIGISVSLSDTMPYSAYEFLNTYSGKNINVEKSKYVTYELSSKFVFTKTIDNLALKRNYKNRYVFNKGSAQAKGSLSKAEFSIAIEGETVLDWHVFSEDIPDSNGDSTRKYFIHLPSKYFEDIGGNNMMDLECADESEYVSAEVILDGLLPGTIRAKWKRKGDLINEKKETSNFPLPPAIDMVLSDFRYQLDEMHHLGPLRAPGKRFYLATTEETGFDSAGEFLPYILRDKKSAMAFNCFPNKDWECLETELSDALNYWLYFFRTGKFPDKVITRPEIKVKTKDTVLVNLEMRSQCGDALYSLADSGFGYSQILPILVRCLLADFGEILIIEQPELHLNPALQVRLAEFFVAMSMFGKQIIIETHSEHIVNAIRVLCAEDDLDEIRKNTKIFYLDNKNNLPIIHELSIKSDGSVPFWPKAFFGEALNLTGRLLRAQNKHRKI